MTDYGTCVRCGRKVHIDSAEFNDGEATPEGQYICKQCVAPEERQAIDEDDMALGDALEDAGLGSADLEVMDEDEYKMREQLAQVLYEQDRPRPREENTE